MSEHRTFRTLVRIERIVGRGIADVCVPMWDPDCEFSILIFKHTPPWLYPYLEDGKRLHVRADLEAETAVDLIRSFHDWERN